jgi:Uma2 family endonuclease
MSQVLTEPRIGQTSFTLHFSPAVELSDEQFFALCQLNRGLRLERTAEGDIIVMAPAGWITGIATPIIRQLRTWAKADGTGVGTDSSTGFQLPNGADRAPDAARVLRSRVARLTVAQKESFLPLCPDSSSS